MVRQRRLHGNDFIAIAAGGDHSLALKSDGISLAGVTILWQATPPDGNDFVAIAAGFSYSLALKSDGSIVGWGQSYGRQRLRQGMTLSPLPQVQS